MIDYTGSLLKGLAEARGKYQIKSRKLPNIAYISKKYEPHFDNPESSLFGFKGKLLGMRLVFMDTFEWEEIVIGCKKREDKQWNAE